MVCARSGPLTHRLRGPPTGWPVGPIHRHATGGPAGGREGADQQHRLPPGGVELRGGGHHDGGHWGGNWEERERETHMCN